MTSTVETEPAMDRALLNELVHWIKTLSGVGVSADKAAEIASDFFMSAYSSGHEECDEEYDDEE